VTRDNGVVPSMSVTWRRLGHLVASWFDDGERDTARAQDASFGADARRAGISRLQAAFRSPPPPQLRSDEDWLPRTRAIVSQ
jgi:hypothetical protein